MVDQMNDHIVNGIRRRRRQRSQTKKESFMLFTCVGNQNLSLAPVSQPAVFDCCSFSSWIVVVSRWTKSGQFWVVCVVVVSCKHNRQHLAITTHKTRSNEWLCDASQFSRLKRLAGWLVVCSFVRSTQVKEWEKEIISIRRRADYPLAEVVCRSVVVADDVTCYAVTKSVRGFVTEIIA